MTPKRYNVGYREIRKLIFKSTKIVKIRGPVINNTRIITNNNNNNNNNINNNNNTNNNNKAKK